MILLSLILTAILERIVPEGLAVIGSKVELLSEFHVLVGFEVNVLAEAVRDCMAAAAAAVAMAAVLDTADVDLSATPKPSRLQAVLRQRYAIRVASVVSEHGVDEVRCLIFEREWELRVDRVQY